jgi:hypothetical protein
LAGIFTLIIKDYGKIDSFLENFNFSAGTEDWNDYSGGNFVVVKDVGFYYARINGYSSESGNDYIETGLNLTSTSDDFVFECLFDHIAYYVYRTPGKKSITVKIKIQVTIGSYYLTAEGWTTEASFMEFEVGSSIESPNWKSLRVIASTIPTSGELKVRLYRANIIASDPNYDLIVTHIGTCYTNVKISTDALIEYPSPQKYRVSIKDNAAGGSNEIVLKPVDTPVLQNAKLVFENANYVGDITSGLWSNNGDTAKTIEQAIANQIATYYNKPRHKISGCDWRGTGLHLNAVAQHINNNNRKFIVNHGSWNILEDTFNVVWIETAGVGSATAIEDSEEQPVSEPRSGGITPNPGDSHPPVIINENSTDYLTIDDNQVLEFIPEDYHWFLHSPEEVLSYVDVPGDFNLSINGDGSISENFDEGYYQVTALNENGETTAGNVQAFYILDDTTELIISWPAVEGAIKYRVYNTGLYPNDVYDEILTTSFDHFGFLGQYVGTPPDENTAANFNNPFRIEKADTVEFKGEHIDVETSATGTNKEVMLIGHPAVTIATGSESFLSITGEQELSLDLPSGYVQSDWNQTNDELADFIKNKPELHNPVTIASGFEPYVSISAEQELSIAPTGFQSDWEQADIEAINFIKNKPELHNPVTIATGSADYISISAEQELSIIPSGFAEKDYQAFEYRNIEAGTADTFVLDLMADEAFTINSIALRVDDGTLTGIAVKINGTSVTGLGSITATTTATRTNATGANSVSVDDEITVEISTGYTGTPTKLIGKLSYTIT